MSHPLEGFDEWWQEQLDHGGDYTEDDRKLAKSAWLARDARDRKDL